MKIGLDMYLGLMDYIKHKEIIFLTTKFTNLKYEHKMAETVVHQSE